ncbi:erythromycin esterase family protein [Paenibacillus antri]|uniref:Erythromycin esterase family protein n=1 Tax=Paenibacillus antri TaxID=2582848 RepID=A0A5R9GGV5_9BACL|nr:erythromycin esterase family protein [Paenibacillus antri]TLS52564.1 erythromycin esterase family protein [Paenibacillus antri]
MLMQSMIEQIKRSASALRSSEDYAALALAAADARFALLGEASHGTSEFYAGRAEITKRLIESHGFRFIAVEGDWPSCMALNKYVKRAPDAPVSVREAMRAFDRWPSWMWANEEIAELVEWLRAYNDKLPEGDVKVGFYGIDVYSLWESLDEMIAYLGKIGSPALEQAQRAFECFEAHQRDEQSYAVSAGLYGEDCEDDVVRLLAKVRRERHAAAPDAADGEASLSAEVNALVAVDAEAYYRTMVRGDAESWNVRDRHMVDALDLVASFYGPDSRGVVWEHNTHIGDARATDMAREGMVNVGQLTREKYGADAVYAIGFGTYRGTVVAGSSWGAQLEIMTVPPGVPDSWEHLLHEAGAFDKYVLLRNDPEPFRATIPHRAIGVVYDPRRERFGNYVPSVIADRYDAFVFYDETKALRPIEPAREPAPAM